MHDLLLRENIYTTFYACETCLTNPKTRSHKRIHQVPSTFWSCSIVNYYASNTFMTIITNANRESLLPSSENFKTKCDGQKEFYVLDGVYQRSPELILGNLSRPSNLLMDQQVQIWYGQDWADCSEHNDNDTSCVDIFAWYV